MQTATEAREWTNGLAAGHDLNILLTMSAHASSGPAGAGRVQPFRGQDELRPGCLTVPLEHDPEKWKPVFPSGQTRSVCPEIMLKQKDKARVQFISVGSDSGEQSPRQSRQADRPVSSRLSVRNRLRAASS